VVSWRQRIVAEHVGRKKVLVAARVLNVTHFVYQLVHAKRLVHRVSPVAIPQVPLVRSHLVWIAVQLGLDLDHHPQTFIDLRRSVLQGERVIIKRLLLAKDRTVFLASSFLCGQLVKSLAHLLETLS